jgi:hypothetical protein
MVLGQPDGVEAHRFGVNDQIELVPVHVAERTSPRRRVAKAEHETEIEPVIEHLVTPWSVRGDGGQEIVTTSARFQTLIRF